MYLGTLSVTGENIMAFLLNNLGKEYSVRELAKAVKQDYKIVFTTVQVLKEKSVITVKRVSNINQCSASLSQDNASLFSYISQRHTMKKLSKTITTALTDVVTSNKNSLYVLLVFGSYAKGNATPKSDLDLLFIVSDRTQEPQIMAAIKKASTLNNLKISPVILTMEEFKSALKEPSVAQEAYQAHFVVHGGEPFYEMIQHV